MGSTGTDSLEEWITGVTGGIHENLTELHSDDSSLLQWHLDSLQKLELLKTATGKHAVDVKQDDISPFSKEIEIKSKTPAAQRILRTHFVSNILKLMEFICKYHRPGKTNSANAIAELFRNIQSYSKRNPDDPFNAFMYALLDGLSYKQKWMGLGKDEYQRIHHQIETLCNREIKDYKLIDQEIRKLEKLGIDTTPYGEEG